MMEATGTFVFFKERLGGVTTTISFTPSDARRDGAHQYAGWERGCSTGDIQTDALERTDDLSKRAAQFICEP